MDAFLASLLFYLTFSLFLFIGLPVLARLTSNKILVYSTAKLVGLLIFGYFIWLLSSFDLLDYQNRRLIMLLFISAIITGAFLSRRFFKDFYKEILTIECITIALYIAYLFLRSWNPAINGTERFMDMAMLTSAGKTHFFPFLDPWFAGKTVNYYYYGSYLMSLISNLSKIPYALSYNFSLGLIYSQATFLSAVLVFSITRSKIISALSAFLVTTSGALFFAGCATKAFFANQICSYASSTRLYTPSYIINEIPSYSFTVGDLHAHLLALPFFILGLVLTYILSKDSDIRWPLLFLLALSIASSGLINAWDAITLSILVGTLVIIKSFKKNKNWLFAGIFVIVVAFVLMWPNLSNFNSPVTGLGFSPTFVTEHNLTNIQYPTPLLAELGLWGIFVTGIFFVLVHQRKEVNENIYLIALVVVSFGIIIGVELFFIGDIYSIANPPYFRANTTFKFGYHAWVMLAIAFGLVLNILQKKKRLAICLSMIALAGGLFYPYQAAKQFYFSNQKQANLDGSLWIKNTSIGDLETINYINENFHDRKIIAEAVGDSYTTFARISTFTGMIAPMGWKTHEWTWRFNIKAAKNTRPGQAVETGWGAVAGIAADIGRLYETSDPAEALAIIDKYKIEYVYIGDLERSTYKNLQEQKFSKIGTEVFRSSSSALYRAQ